ncbi:uncharacterized protein LOC120678345 [Panicum virgatum]|uniref:uncharacterized protein LOC120678345 n=1 Tax=Panicum virgatum TaxID=38727 RepID=UPI0019D660AA|nr:uncharacterized protein LOC120678345 [Panicum virgatum]
MQTGCNAKKNKRLGLVAISPLLVLRFLRFKWTGNPFGNPSPRAGTSNVSLFDSTFLQSFSVHLMIAPTLPAHLHLKTRFMGRSANTGLYVVHYARAFDGQWVDFDLKEQSECNLAEP